MTTRSVAHPVAVASTGSVSPCPLWQVDLTQGVIPPEFAGLGLRLDGANGLLAEPTATNGVLNSNDLSVWNLNGGATLNQATPAPDGSGNMAYSIVFSAASSASGVYRGASGLTTGTVCTISGYFKNLSGDPTIYVGSDSAVWGSGGPMALNFNSATGAENGWETAVTAHHVQAMGNGWYRASVTATLASGTTPNVVVYHSASAAGETAVWGLQAEVGGFATSLMPTMGATATRFADGLVLGNLAPIGFNPAEGTLFVEAVLEGVSGTQPLLQLDNGDVGNVLTLGQTGGHLVAKSVASGSTGLNAQVVASPVGLTSYKVALAYANGALAACANGGTVSTANASVPADLNTLRLGSDGLGHFTGGWLKWLAYYPVLLADGDLKNLTA